MVWLLLTMIVINSIMIIVIARCIRKAALHFKAELKRLERRT